MESLVQGIESLVKGMSGLKIENEGTLDPNTPIEYMSYEAEDQESFRTQIKQKLVESIAMIKQVYPEIDEQEMIESIDSYKIPLQLHVTIAYLGGKTVEFMRHEQEYKSEEEKEKVLNLLDNFRTGKEIDVKIMGYGIIENKIITGFAFVDKEREEELKTKSLNGYEHMTLGTRKWKAVDSNFLLQQVFDDYSKYEVKYDEDFLKEQTIVKRIETKGKNQYFDGKGFMVAFGNNYLSTKLKTVCHYRKVSQKKSKQNKKQKQEVKL